MSTPHRSLPSNASPETLTLTLTLTQPNNQTDQLHFTDEDEINLLKSYLQISRSENPTKNSLPTLDSPAFDRLQTAVGPKFSHSVIADKLHRLKLLYHKFARTKSFIKTPHQRQILDLGRSIWGKSPTPITRKPQVISPSRILSRRIKQRSSTRKEGVGVDIDLKNFPVLVAEFSQQFPGNGVWREGLRRMEEKNLKDMNEKWVLLHIEGAELKARRAALLKQQLKNYRD
ncbi:hypothetical protein IC582_026820 [Cucumis melo]|nr:serine/arginine repetitive matrix protein 1-like [Cucumis melo var. makuwa]TYK24183.1 serine/arginine repetitive matrix protein 1-like [Cucumis melo var. makuwa]